mgnify:CR=1 FL=1
MAVTKRGKRTAYDNIATGSATGAEFLVGGTVSVFERHAGGLYTSTSNDELVGHSNIAAGTSTSDDNLGPEQIVQAGAAVGDETAGTSNTPGAVTNP